MSEGVEEGGLSCGEKRYDNNQHDGYYDDSNDDSNNDHYVMIVITIEQSNNNNLSFITYQALPQEYHSRTTGYSHLLHTPLHLKSSRGSQWKSIAHHRRCGICQDRLAQRQIYVLLIEEKRREVE